MKTRILIFIYFLLYCNFGITQVIPDSKRVNWSFAGINGNIQKSEILLDVTDFGAIGDGITDNYSAIIQAINTLNGNAGTIYFPPGDYLVNSGLILPDSVILSGHSSISTKLKFNLNGASLNCINISGHQPDSFFHISSGYFKGSVKIIVDDISAFSPGDFTEVRQQNGEWDTNPASWAEYAVGQIIEIKSISDDTLILKHPLRIDFESSLCPEIGKIIPITNIGIETLNIERLDNVSNSGPNNISINYAKQCWINGVESNKSVGSHIMIRKSSNIDVTGCYIHHAFLYDGASTRGYGITLCNHAGECLIQNNIFEHLRHAMVVKVGANGNVFGYNYSVDPYRSELPHNFTGDISLHGHYAFSNLFESNINQNIVIDHYWGPSGPYNTFFRNRVELLGIIMTSSGVETNDQNFVGNEITNNGLFMGNYYLSGTGHFEYGNNIKGIIVPAGTNYLSDSSYYLYSPPDFQNTINAWPTIGIPNTINSGTIQAKKRYLAGDYTYIKPVAFAGDNNTIIAGSSITLIGTATYGIEPYTFKWSPDYNLNNPNIYNPIANPLITTTYNLTITDKYGCVATDEVIIYVISGIEIKLKNFFEGPFNGTDMNTDLNSGGHIPLSQPYNILPWNYIGTESVSSIPNTNVVDWVLVELRDTTQADLATSETMIGRQAAFILNDGLIVGLDGSSFLSFNHSINHSLFIVIWHRNHLGVMSAYPLTEVSGIYSYDFTTGANQAYGGSLGHKKIGTGIWGMIGGDGDANSQIGNADKNDVWAVQAGTSGYLSGDFTMDVQVNNSDKNDIWTPNSGKGGQVPDNIQQGGFKCMVPK
ncbi:MAG: glycoside hydrolase family 55 protein [Bacteroidales bacterium]|nr:glycoside hydrolase family 55 protein [Bacteroidales bacterium]